MNRNARRFLVIVMAFALLVAGVPARAEGEIHVVLGSQELTFDVPPALVNGRVLVPLRKIFEALGAKVAYDQPTRQVTAWKGPITVQLTIDDPAVRIDGETKQLDVPPQVVDGRTLVPLRFVSEALGGQVAWDPATRTATIVTTEGTAKPQDLVLDAEDLPGGKWTALEQPADLPEGWKKVMVSTDPAEPYSWISSALQPVGEGAGAWVQDRTCRPDETEIAAPKDLLLWNTAKFCQSWGSQGNLVVTTYVAAGEYVLTMAASPRGEQTTADEATTLLEGLAAHQLILLGKLARGESRPAPMAALPAPGEKPAATQPHSDKPAGQATQPAVQPPTEPDTEKPALGPVHLPPTPSLLTFAVPATISVSPDPPKDPDKVLHSFCAPRPVHLTSPCGPMPETTNPTGGNPPYHFTLGPMGGFPPTGVSLLKDGHLVGQPAPNTAGKTFKFTVCATDLSADSVCWPVTLSVGQPSSPPLQFTAPALPKATAGSRYETSLPAPTGGKPPYAFDLQNGGLPQGIWLNPDGSLQGWPSEDAGGKVYTFTVCALDALQQRVCREVSLQVDPKPPTLMEQFENTAWSGNFTANFEKYGSIPGTVDFTFGPATGDRIDVVKASVSFHGWRFKLDSGYLAFLNDHTCLGLVMDFDLLEEGPEWDLPSNLEWFVRYLHLQVDLGDGSKPTRVDPYGVTAELTPSSLKGRAETYRLNPPGTFAATKR